MVVSYILKHSYYHIPIHSSKLISELDKIMKKISIITCQLFPKSMCDIRTE